MQVARIGPPNDSRDAFRRLESAGRLSSDLSTKLQAMVGFRNVAVHRYHELDLAVLRAILDHRLADLLAFADLVEREWEGTSRVDDGVGLVRRHCKGP